MLVRRILLVILAALVGLIVLGKVRRLRADAEAAAAAAGAGPELRLAARLGDHRPRPPVDLPAGLVPPLDSLTRAGARVRLDAEPERQYLDSLFAETDSILRHWPVGGSVIPFAIMPGGPEGFRPEMVSEIRWAIDTWSPASVGLRFAELSDTAGALFVVRWADTLNAERAGLTDVTWDRAGRIRRIDVYLVTRSPGTGRPLTVELRRAVALHEIGHALGLPHSSRAGDVMFPVATATALSDRDRFSLRLLYELPTGWIGTTGPAPAR